MRFGRQTAAAALTLPATALLLAGCGSDDAAANACAKPSGEVLEVGHKDGEPTFGLAIPKGWEEMTSGSDGALRLVAHSGGTGAEGGQQAAVTVEDAPTQDVTLEMKRQVQGLEAAETGISDVRSEVGPEVCGYPTGTITYALNADKAPGNKGMRIETTATVFLVPKDDAGSTAAVLTVQSASPDDPANRKALSTLVDEFQIDA
ncbi:hypothetical protein [Gordonia shandongensis]|uniref:hypothetical protein n=1 Tax=Gordonia shandongensis TaxID=376351 RepID=UPI000425C33A|nr:hypothetical protein [Gordonia shandongensis]